MAIQQLLRVSASLALFAGAVACSSTDEERGSGDGGGSGGSGGGGAPSVPAECSGKPLPPRATSTQTSRASMAPYFPTTEWRTATPSEAGFDEAKLNEALAYTTPQSNTTGILVLRGGYIVAEKYAGSANQNTRSESYSMAKSFTSALVGIAIEKGLLSGVEEKICQYYSDVWDCDDAADPRTRIQVKHTMNVETGLDWHEDWRSTANILQNDAVRSGANMLDYVLAKRGLDEPGSVKRYSTGDPSLLSGVIQGAAGKTALEFGREVLFNKIGIPDIQWSQDSKGRTTTYAQMRGTVREFGKFGFLYSRHGVWDGEQVVPGDWVDYTTRAVDPCKEQYRYLWHINLPQRFGAFEQSCADFPSCVPTAFGDFPSDAFFAEGIQGQFIFIVPSRDLVVVRNASDAMGSEFWDEYGHTFLTKVLEALEG